jgi:hypothetical protein
MSINLTGAEEIRPKYDQEVEILADEVEDLISWGVNTQETIKGYLSSEDTWNSAKQVGKLDDALDYLEDEGRITKTFKKYDDFDIGYVSLD